MISFESLSVLLPGQITWVAAVTAVPGSFQASAVLALSPSIPVLLQCFMEMLWVTAPVAWLHPTPPGPSSFFVNAAFGPFVPVGAAG